MNIKFQFRPSIIHSLTIVDDVLSYLQIIVKQSFPFILYAYFILNKPGLQTNKINMPLVS